MKILEKLKTKVDATVQKATQVYADKKIAETIEENRDLLLIAGGVAVGYLLGFAFGHTRGYDKATLDFTKVVWKALLK